MTEENDVNITFSGLGIRHRGQRSQGRGVPSHGLFATLSTLGLRLRLVSVVADRMNEHSDPRPHSACYSPNIVVRTDPTLSRRT